MELRLSTPPECVHADTFVSVRIGDVQKQSRLTTSRTYHFPAAGDGRGRFGRIEVFKRVGDLTVDLSNHDGSEQSVEVPCNVPGMASLSLGLAVKGEPLDAIKQAKAQPGSARGKVKWDAAQKYIAEHSLEDVLADAMREVIRHKPEDPFAFLSEQILAKKSTVAAKPAVVPVTPPQQAQQSSAPPAGAPGERAVAAAAPALPAPVPSSTAPAPAPVAAPAPQPAPQPLAFAHRPSVGSWLQPISPGGAKTPNPGVTSEKELGNLTSAPSPSPAAPTPPPPAVPFPMRPSVGSWLTARPNFEIIKLKEEAALKKAALLELERKPFQLRPSVGTWLAPRSMQEPEPASMFRSLSPSDMAKMSQDQLIATFQSELERKDKQIEELKATLRKAK